MTGSLCAARAALLVVVAVLIWSWIGAYSRFTWWLEALPVIIALPLLCCTFKRFPLTPLAYFLAARGCVFMLAGAHYTYPLVPLFNHLQDMFGLSRNHYDRVGHFFQGFISALFARELLLRASPLKPGTWLNVIILLSCLGISAAYELAEWLVGEALGIAAEAFLGMQGDIWDTQKDMAIATFGAAMALLLLSRWHDRLLTNSLPAPAKTA